MIAFGKGKGRMAFANKLGAGRGGLRLGLVGVAAALALSACGEPKATGVAPQARRLSEVQYRQTVADIFGADIKIAGRFEPGIREGGLLSVGSSKLAAS